MDSPQAVLARILARSPLWALLPNRMSMLTLGLANMPDVFDMSWEAAKPSVTGKTGNKMMTIPITGVLTKDGPSWLGNNYDSIADAAEKAAADPDVKRIVLSVDSPGGEVTGLPETAAVLASVAKVKPVSAMVEGISASAAYWLTSQSQDITLAPSGEVGSVGVRMMHADISKMLEDAGVKITEMYSGDFKTEWSPYKPLTEDAQADMQKRLTAVHQDFIDSVSNGRGNRTTEDIKKARFGEGRMFSATDAMTHGLVDKVTSPREYYRAITPPVEQEVSAPAFGLPRRARLEVEKHRF